MHASIALFVLLAHGVQMAFAATLYTECTPCGANLCPATVSKPETLSCNQEFALSSGSCPRVLKGADCSHTKECIDGIPEQFDVTLYKAASGDDLVAGFYFSQHTGDEAAKRLVIFEVPSISGKSTLALKYVLSGNGCDAKFDPPVKINSITVDTVASI